MRALIKKLPTASFIANLCFFTAIILRLPDGPQYLIGIGTTFVLCVITFGAAILLSGYRPQSPDGSTPQRGSD